MGSSHAEAITPKINNTNIFVPRKRPNINLFPKSDIVGSMRLRVVRSSSTLADTSEKFYTRNNCPLKNQIFEFLTIINFFNILKNYPAIPDVLSSNGFWKVF